MHRSAAQVRNASMVEFERYAFDLSQLTGNKTTDQSRASDKTFSDLISSRNEDGSSRLDAARIRVELHKRLSTPLYALAAFIIPFGFLGLPRTTRQTRGAAMAGAATVFMTIEIAGFGTWGFVQRSEYAWPLPYLVPLSGIIPGLLAVMGLIELQMPASLQRLADNLVARLQRLETA
jgi:lipopolysaccharide export system permease protein